MLKLSRGCVLQKKHLNQICIEALSKINIVNYFYLARIQFFILHFVNDIYIFISHYSRQKH